MTCDERIEALLERAHNTISDLPAPQAYDGECAEAYSRKALEACGIQPTEDDTVTIGELIFAACGYGLHLTDVVERLCWALENTVQRYEKAKYRLNSWGDIQYVADLEDGKI